MKKQLAIILAILLIASVVFVACDNATPEHQHTWSEDWSGNADQHWHDCTAEDCSEKKDLGNHTDSGNTGVCSVCGCTLSSTPTPQPQDSVTLYFYNAEGWQDVYAYTYNVANEELLGVWPGTKTTQDSREGWVKIDVEANPATDAFNIIFNDGASNQTTDLVIDDAQNVYLIGKADGTYASYAEAETAASQKPATSIVASVHLHKPSTWSEDGIIAYIWGKREVLGSWGTTKMTAGDNGWYSVSINMTDEVISNEYHLILSDESDTTGALRVNIDINYAGENIELWIAQDGHIFSSKAEVEQYESLDRDEYTIAYYAPDWPAEQDVYLYTYNGTLGEIGAYNANKMQAVENKTGWYSVSFETAVDVTSFSVIFHAENDDVNNGGIKHEFYVENLTGNAFYFIANGNNAYTTEAEAVTAYNANKALADTNEIDVVFHLYAPDWTEVGVHTWNGYVTGSFGSVTMTADAENTGWWTYSFKVAEGELTGKGINIIFFDKINDTQDHPVRITTYTNDASYVFFNANKADDNKFTSMADALATEGGSSDPVDPDEDDAINVVVNLHKNPDWSDADIIAYIHGEREVLGGWGITKMTAGEDGWYSVTINMKGETISNNYHLILADASDTTEKIRVLIDINYTGEANTLWLAKDGQAFASKELALAHEEQLANITTYNYRIWLYAPDKDVVKIHMYYRKTEATSDTAAGTAWGASQMTKEDGDTGWFYYDLNDWTEDIFSVSSGLNVMFMAENNDTMFTGWTTASDYLYFTLSTQGVANSK